QESAGSGWLLRLASPIFILGMALLLAAGTHAYLGRNVDAKPGDGNSVSAEHYRQMIAKTEAAATAGAFAQQFSDLAKSAKASSAAEVWSQVRAQHAAIAGKYLAGHRELEYVLLALLAM